MNPDASRSRIFLCGVVLAVATFFLYFPATRFEFVAYDDDLYVFNNPQVRSGLSWSSLKWALTSTSAANWHPLTWISHIVDYSLFGASAGGHHLTSVVLHSLNTLLLFLVLTRLTASPWPALVVAAFFGWHPLRVESVAWVSERKDVLSALFWMLSLGAYARYAEELKVHRANFKMYYAGALMFFALGMMSKPMVVTLPFVLLLLDYWPLQRCAAAATPRAWRPLLLEKAPFFALAAAACVVTVFAQHSGGAIKTLNQVPFATRVWEVPLAYGTYICKTLWPARLCAFYPLPVKPPAGTALCALAALAAITLMAWLWRRSCPWLPVGWFWFLGTLVPVIGLIKAGDQAIADRFTYVPSIGLLIMVVWSAHHWLAARPPARLWAGALAAACLLGCVLVTQKQLATWRDSISFYSQILSVNKNCVMAQNGLGWALSQAGRSGEAIDHFREALRLDPNLVRARLNLGIELANAGDSAEALAQFTEGLKLDPRNEQLLNNAGVALAQQGKTELALVQFQRAIAADPGNPRPYLNCAMAWEKLGHFQQALTNCQEALRLDPASQEIRQTLDRLRAAEPPR
ncbi:MAG: tetratricopeptide repeat protein [Verrucomicrobiota bacterium]|jgi:tetratricopeptide (TPR) repeat protein